MLNLGEAVIHDLRADVFAHLQRMTMDFYHRTKLGRIISRMTSDIDAVRQGVQDVLFVSIVQVGQMLIAGLMMLSTDPVLFSAVLALAPIVWLINRHFRARLSRAYREQQESFSRITATLGGVGQRHPGHAGFRAPGGQRRDVPRTGGGSFPDRLRRGAAGGDVPAAAGAEQPVFHLAILLLLGGYRALNPAVAMPVGT